MSEEVYLGPNCDELTQREATILKLLAMGRQAKEIAVELGIAVKTAETHRANILKKLHVSSSLLAVMYALRRRIITIDFEEFHGS